MSQVEIWSWLLGLLLGGCLLRQWIMRKERRRALIRQRSFPPAYETILQARVAFYRALPEPERVRFRESLLIFLDETRITGIQTEVDDTCRLLAAASAIIPIFGFPGWQWDAIGEILIYPTAFDDQFKMGRNADGAAIGMVGNGALDRVMILSKPDLIHGFDKATDKRNVGIHEFAHLVDKADGVIDGLPALGLGRAGIEPWLALMREEMEKIRSGRSDIDTYALTNEAEFFAVTSEYFFEAPGVMQRKHPRLYEMLAKIFRQDMRSRLAGLVRSVFRPHGRRVGRNAPCPCDSGCKYKKCCLPS